MLATRSLAAQRLALAHARLATAAWTRAANAGDRAYQRDLTFGPGRHLRGTWSARLDEVAREANDIQVYQMQDTPKPTHSSADADRVIALLRDRKPVTRLDATLRGAGDLHSRRARQGERRSHR